jgi:acylphosphatase
MRSMHYRILGAFEITVRPHGGDATLAPVDMAAFRQWVEAVARDVGLEPRAVAVSEGAVWMVALAASPRAVPALARWVPAARARPLHEVQDYFRAVTDVVRVAREAGTWDATDACGTLPASGTA